MAYNDELPTAGRGPGMIESRVLQIEALNTSLANSASSMTDSLQRILGVWPTETDECAKDAEPNGSLAVMDVVIRRTENLAHQISELAERLTNI